MQLVHSPRWNGNDIGCIRKSIYLIDWGKVDGKSYELFTHDTQRIVNNTYLR